MIASAIICYALFDIIQRSRTDFSGDKYNHWINGYLVAGSSISNSSTPNPWVSQTNLTPAAAFHAHDEVFQTSPKYLKYSWVVAFPSPIRYQLPVNIPLFKAAFKIAWACDYGNLCSTMGLLLVQLLKKEYEARSQKYVKLLKRKWFRKVAHDKNYNATQSSRAQARVRLWA